MFLDFIKGGLPIVKKYNAKMVLVYNTQSMQTCMLSKITLQSEMFFFCEKQTIHFHFKVRRSFVKANHPKIQAIQNHCYSLN
jgi:hypothetical protein